MSITARPLLSVDGQLVPTSTAGAPVLVAVDQLRITYGRQGVFDQSTPATASVAVLDLAAGAPFAARTDLIGRQMVLSWDAGILEVDPGVIFRGRITDVDVAPRSGGGFRVALSASSMEVDLASVIVPEGTKFPAETFAARATRLGGYVPASVGTLDQGPGASFTDQPCAALDAGGRDVLALLRQLFTSMAPWPMVYDPSIVNPRAQHSTYAALTYPGRRRYAYGDQTDALNHGAKTTSAYLWPNTDAGGLLVATSLSGLHLDSHKLAYSGSLSQRPEQNITRVEVTYVDPTAGSLTVAAATTWTPAEATTGRRTLSVDSLHTTAANAAALANLYADVVNREAASRTFGPVTFTTAREPFPDIAHAQALLSGAERAAAVFLGRSWLPRLGRRPLVGICGGTITYADGDWTVDLIPAPVVVDPLGHSWAPATIASAAPTVKLSDVHESVTFGDLAFIDVGPGYFPGTDFPYKGNPT